MPFWLILAGAFGGLMYWLSGDRSAARGDASPSSKESLGRKTAKSARMGAWAFVGLMVLRMGPWRAWALLSSAMAAWPALARLLQWDAERDPSRTTRSEEAPPQPRNTPMSRRDAALLLDITESASRADIEAAYRKLMQRVHPDAGGSAHLAQLVNEARDVLLR
jgi:hypothetical protein